MIGFLADVPVDIDRDPARLRAIQELTDPGYVAARPGFLEQVWQWLGRRISELFNALSGVPGGPLGLVLVLVLVLALVIVLIVVVRLRVGKVGRSAKTSGEVFSGRRKTADEYRKTAEVAAGRGDFADAVRDRFRALVRGMEERALLDVRSGRTADEAGRFLPDLAGDLTAAARLFDDVHYGGRPGTETGYRSLSDVDERVRRARPALADA